jgi:hypothetical protein
MAAVTWDQLLETCCKNRATDILLVAGSPPSIRSWNDGWQLLQVPPLDADDLRRMVDERFPRDAQADSNGWVDVDLSYGRVWWFRAKALHFPNPTLLLISWLPRPPAGAIEGATCHHCALSAVVHTTEIRDGEQTEIHLCRDHAQQLGFGVF